jgi:hypothetical protein
MKMALRCSSGLQSRMKRSTTRRSRVRKETAIVSNGATACVDFVLA